jgi:hypothetical protein
MAQETKVEETLCSLQTFERNRYFYGKPMTVSDFEAEQRYLIGKQRYVNRLVHGAGVLCGLQVTLPTGFSADHPAVELAEGAALDCCGNLIVVSRSSTVEIKEGFDPEHLNYLFIKYAECSKQPVMLAANGSSCEEVCCYNRIQETFEIVASTAAPGGAATSPAAAAPSKASKTSKAVKTTEPPPDPATVCRNLTEAYYQEHLRTCPGCDNPLVFLAVLDPESGRVDDAETARYRSVVFNNSMLHELLCDHVTDYNNPHRTSAEQVRALQSVNGVGNNSTRSWVANINLDSPDKTLTVKGDTTRNKIDLTLGADAVRLSHLNEEVIRNLVQESPTVKVVTNTASKTITLNTTPAQSVTSVGGARVVGTSSNFAPEDHAHDLAERVVERKHLGDDVYAGLIQGGGAIKVEGDAAARRIRVSADAPPPPSDDLTLVSSVNGAKRVGESVRYAREDHAHDLYINGLSPNARGQFRLIAGTNVTIEEGSLNNELIISAEGGGQTVVATGFVVFENVLPQQLRTSGPIPHNLESGVVAVILAEEMEGGLPTDARIISAAVGGARFGDTTDFFLDAPFLMADVDYGQRTLRISLRDRRQGVRATSGPSSPSLSPAGETDFTFARETATREEIEASAFREPAETFAPSGELLPTEPDGPIIISTDARNYRIRWWAVPAPPLAARV